MLDALKLGFGLALLLGGAQGLVWGASRLAASLKIPPLVIGLTVVAFGTSSPELAASLTSARAGSPGLAVGNVVGSNIFNVLVILGLAAIVRPLRVDRKLVRFDVPIMISVSVLAFVVGGDGTISRVDGIVLVAILVTYLAWLIWEVRRGDPAGEGEAAGARPPLKPGAALAGVAALAGLGALTLGASWLVDASTTIATTLGVSDLIVGLTLVAAGTSLPELATSVLASVRGERDLAVGNVVGSNIFNILCVLGVSSLGAPAGLAVAGSALSSDMILMIAVSVVCLPVLVTGFQIDRWEGALFLSVYALYAGQLYLASLREGTPSPLWVVLALLGGVLAIALAQVRSQRRR